MPLVGLALASLAAGTLGGLVRLGWSLPEGRADLALLHGPLLVFGFLGTVIGLERAVALGRVWGFAAPAGTVLGAALLLAGVRQGIGQLVLLAAGGVLVAVLALLVRRRVTFASVLLVAAAACFATGTLLWLAGLSVREVVPWWTAFLVVTIVAERLELAGLRGPDPRAVLLLGALLGVLGFGLVLSHVDDAAGARLVGLAYLGVAAALATFGVARHTIRRPGLPRFVAVALAAGYVWLAVAGSLWLVHGAPAGLVHDAASHALFLGFVFSMIFAHAPIVFPALFGLAVPFRRPFYLHLGLLHAGLAVRVAGDLAGDRELARAGGLVSAVAIVLFVAMTAGSALAARRGGTQASPARGPLRGTTGS